MRSFGIFVAATTLVVVFAATGVYAQTATTEPVGKPLALLAGLRPPHEAKHKASKHAVHARAEYKTTRKDAVRERHVKITAAHTGHVAVKKLARRKYERHERAVTASAFAEESPQADSDPPAVPHWPTASSSAAPVEAAAGQTDAPMTDNARLSAETDSGPAASKVQTIKITAPNSASLPDPAIGPVAAPTGKTTDPVGSASWIAQVLAALGGAVTAGAVAWFLIGGRPAQTYG